MPNAFDYFTKAAMAIVDQDQVDGHTIETTPSFAEVPIPPSARESLQTLVVKNSVALALLDQGLQYPCLDPPIRSLSTRMPNVTRFLSLAKLIDDQAQLDQRRGDNTAAAEEATDDIKFGADITRGSEGVNFTNGIYIQAIGRKRLWVVSPKLSDPQSEAVLLAVQTAEESAGTDVEVLQQEKLAGQSELKSEFRKPAWRLNMVTDLFDEWGVPRGGQPALLKSALQLAMDTSSPQKMLAQNDAYFNDQIRVARAPYAAHVTAKRLALDPFHLVMFMMFKADPATWWNGLRLTSDRSEAETSLLLVTLALNAYHSAYGVYPATLAALAPRYIDRIPNDPFALNEPPKYHRTGSSYLLYSIGPDGKDDGGKPIQGSRLTQSSKGDIVAGVTNH